MNALSLSLFIQDVISGKISEDAVTTVISGTRITDEDSLNSVLNIYANSYWRENPDLAISIARRLFSEDKVYQPRVASVDHPGCNPDWESQGLLNQWYSR